MLSNISYRYKIPASLSLVIVVTAFAVAGPLISGANGPPSATWSTTRFARQDAGGRGTAGAPARRYVAGVRDHHHAVRPGAPAASRSTDHRCRGRPGRDLCCERPRAVSCYASAGEPRAMSARLAEIVTRPVATPVVLEGLDPKLSIMAVPAIHGQYGARHRHPRILARHLQPAITRDHSQGRGVDGHHAGDPGTTRLALGQTDRESAAATLHGHPPGCARAGRDGGVQGTCGQR